MLSIFLPARACRVSLVQVCQAIKLLCFPLAEKVVVQGHINEWTRGYTVECNGKSEVIIRLMWLVMD